MNLIFLVNPSFHPYSKVPPILEEDGVFRQIIVFTKFPELPSIKGLSRAAQDAGRQFLAINPSREASFSLENGQNTLLDHFEILENALLIVRTSGIEFDDYDYFLARHLTQQGITLAEPLWALETLRNKDRQMLFLHTQGFPIIPTFTCRGKLPEKLPWEKNGAHKTVIKSIRGNKGIGHQLLERSELEKFWDESLQKNDQRYILQPYVENAPEVRLLVLGDQVFTLGRELGRDWRKNSDYSSFIPYEPNKKEALFFEHTIKKVRQTLSLKVFAIDLIWHEETWHLLEINSHPALESSKKAMRPMENPYELFLQAYESSF